MQATEAFKKVISNHLQSLGEKDQLFAETLKKPGKNINDCATYILNEVKKSGNNGFADEEIFGMAVHYYDEDNIDVGKPVNGNVVVNHHVEKSSKEKSKGKSASVETPSDEKRPEQKKAAKKTVKKDEQIYLF